MPAALIVASTCSHADSRETLRLQDIASVLVEAGWRVDLLVPRKSQLLTLTLPQDVRVVSIPQLPFTSNLPRRPSIRRLFIGMLMFLRGTSLVARNSYSIVHGVNDGASIVCAIDRVTLRRFAYIADYTSPYGIRGLFRGARAWVARALEHRAIHHAAAVVFAEDAHLQLLERRPPIARVSIIPDPHAEIAPDAFTRAEFTDAIEKVYIYATRD